MKKMSIFCEGLTEQLFAERLIAGVLGKKALIIKAESDGKMGSRSIKILTAKAPDSHHEFFIQIVNCNGDKNVGSDIRELYKKLVGAGKFSAIVAIRDVYPILQHLVPDLLSNLPKFVPTKPVAVTWVVAIREIEAWFLAEDTHLQKIDAALNAAMVKAALGFDPHADDMQIRDHPADDLHKTYQLVGKAYTKDFARINRTVSALDFDRLYLELGDRLPALKLLNQAITDFAA